MGWEKYNGLWYQGGQAGWFADPDSGLTDAQYQAQRTTKIENIPQSDDDPLLTRAVKQTGAFVHNISVDHPGFTGLLSDTVKAITPIFTNLKDSARDPSKIGSSEALLGTLLIGKDWISSKGGRGAEMWATGADTKLGQLPLRKDGKPWVDPTAANLIGTGLTEAVLEGGVAKVFSRIPSIQNLMAPPPSLQTVGIGNSKGLLADGLNFNPAKPLQLQQNVIPGTALRNIPIGSSPSKVRSLLPSKYYNQLNKKYRYLSKKALSENPELLGTLRGREQSIDSLWTRIQTLTAEGEELKKLTKLPLAELKKVDKDLYRKLKQNQKLIKELKKDLQDTAAYNIFGDEKRIYMTSGVRTKLQETLAGFKEKGLEWHHMFNSKDAGEYMLTEVAQDPLIAANLLKHMQALKLHSSGISSNLTLMRKIPHSKWHKLMKDRGIEPAGFLKDLKRWKNADLSLAQYGNDIAAAIKKGDTDVNELFTLLERYKEFQDVLTKELTTKYGAKSFNEIPGVKEIVESYNFQTTTGR